MQTHVDDVTPGRLAVCVLGAPFTKSCFLSTFRLPGLCRALEFWRKEEGVLVLGSVGRDPCDGQREDSGVGLINVSAEKGFRDMIIEAGLFQDAALLWVGHHGGGKNLGSEVRTHRITGVSEQLGWRPRWEHRRPGSSASAVSGLTRKLLCVQNVDTVRTQSAGSL